MSVSASVGGSSPGGPVVSFDDAVPSDLTHEQYFETAQELGSKVVTEDGMSTPENFKHVSDLYGKAYEARLKELGLPTSGQMSASDQEIADTDPMLNLYQAKMEWADKWTNRADAYGMLSPSETFVASRDDISLENRFWMDYSSDPTLDAASREKALIKAEEFGQKLATVQERFTEIMRTISNG